MQALDILRQSVIDAPVVMKGEYAYFVHPLTDGVPRQSARLLEATRDLVQERIDWDEVDVILGIEAMGLPLSAALSLSTGKPMVVVRKRAYGLPGEAAIDQSTGYSKGTLHINDIAAGERVLVVDDVVSTGGTLEPILSTLEAIGATLAGVFIIFEKGEGMNRLRKTRGWKLDSLVRLEMKNNKVALLD
jgi:adenine phosphoribosyltransferase